jgi:hypothetical protein
MLGLLDHDPATKPDFGAALNPADPLVTPAPVAFWAFDEGSGGNVADKGAVGKVATVSGNATWKPGRIGPCFSFDGSTTLTLGGFGYTAATFWFWLNPTGVSGDIRVWSSTSRSLAINQGSGESGSLWVWKSEAGTWLRLANNGTLAAGIWYFIALVFDGTNCTCYVNGVAQLSVAITWDTSSVVFASKFGSFGAQYSGLADLMGVAGRALSVEEIKRLYTQPTAPLLTSSIRRFYQPAAGDPSVVVPAAVVGAVATAPTATPGGVSVACPAAVATAAATAPTATPGGVSVTVPAAVVNAVAIAPAVGGGLSVAVPAAVVSAVATAPTASGGAVAVAVPAAVVVAVAVPPSVQAPPPSTPVGATIDHATYLLLVADVGPPVVSTVLIDPTLLAAFAGAAAGSVVTPPDRLRDDLVLFAAAKRLKDTGFFADAAVTSGPTYRIEGDVRATCWLWNTKLTPTPVRTNPGELEETQYSGSFAICVACRDEDEARLVSLSSTARAIASNAVSGVALAGVTFPHLTGVTDHDLVPGIDPPDCCWKLTVQWTGLLPSQSGHDETDDIDIVFP